MKPNFASCRGLRLAALTLILAQAAPGQFTSSYDYVTIPGNFNGYDTWVPRMRLISNGVWQSYVSLTNHANPEFLFATTNFGTTWKETDQPGSSLPLQGTAEINTGTNITFSTNVTGALRIRFAEGNHAYSVFNVTAADAGGGEPWINEFHYDNTSTDVDEGIEIAGLAGTSLTNYTLYLYNGNGGASYASTNLNETLTNQLNGYGCRFFAISGIQNGAPDGIALVKGGSQVIQFISYEGGMTAADGPADGLAAQAIGVSEPDTTPVDRSLQLTGSGSLYNQFTWSGPSTHSRGSPNAGQTFLSLPAPATVIASNLVSIPSTPLPTNTVHVQVNLSAASGASNLSATTFYRTNSAARFLPLAMTLVSGNYYRTSSPIPAQPLSTLVDYHVFVNFDGPGTNAPLLHPPGAPLTNQTYAVASVAAGSVWINEFNVECDLFDPNSTNEFIEVVGPAGINLSQWTLECYGESSNRYATYRFRVPTVLPNDTNGFGFLLLAESNRPGVDIVFTNNPGGFDLLPASGAFRLLDPVSNTVHAIRYGATNMINFNLFASTYVGEDPQPVFADYTVHLVGTGGTASAFTWVTNDVDASGTPGAINPGQVLTGGNTNPILPSIVCPSNILLSCPSSPVPPPAATSVQALAYCSGVNTVLVTHVSDTTNAGTGCFGSPRIITRTYRAVSSCGTTNECQQSIIIEDKTPPSMTWPTQAMVNAGFEAGTLNGWTPFGAVSNNITATVAFPRSGFFSARIQPPVVPRLLDSSAEVISGTYFGAPTWNQTGAIPATVRSVLFDGVDDRADVPWDPQQNNTNFSFALWARVLSGQGSFRSALTARDDAPTRGFILYAASDNKWTFVTGTGAVGDWHNVVGPSVVTGVWIHIAGTYDAGGRIKSLYTNGTLVASATNVGFSANGQRPLRIGGGATESTPGSFFFPGQLDDVQIYNYPLTPAQVSAIFSSGSPATNAVGHYRLDENPSALTRTSGIHQAISTLTGQTWQASVHLAHLSSAPMTSNTQADVGLQFLNSTGGVVAATNAPLFDQATPKDAYIRYAVSGVAPTNATSARLIVTYRQDASFSPGTLYIDDAVLTPFVVTAGLSCAVLPDYRPLVTATDSCGPVVVSQSPAPGAAVGGSNILVTFTATDPCGLTAQGTLVASVEDTVRPTGTCPPLQNLSCLTELPAPDPARVTAADNCGSVIVTLETNQVSATGGCGAIPKSVIYRYRLTDSSGNFNFCNEAFFIRDSNAPIANCTFPELTNGSFEAGTFANWQTFGTHLAITNILPRSGTRHALIYGATNGSSNFTGMYQDMPAGVGQVWRGAAYILQPESQALQASNRVELKIEFLDSQTNLATSVAQFFTSNSYRDVYVPISVTATAPVGTIKARCTILLVQPNTPSNAPGTVYIDDLTLNRHTVSKDPDLCNAFYPDVMSVPTFIDCGTVTISQIPLPGAFAPLLGWNTNVVYAEDICGQKSQCSMPIYVVDDTPPLLISGPTNVTVTTTNDVPPVNTNSVVGSDTCGIINVLHDGDTNNGASGIMGDPLIIIRTYRVVDVHTNAVLHRQVITVESEVPPAPTNVVIKSFSLGTNLVVHSLGTNTWSVVAEYSTNLVAQPQLWMLLPPITNFFANGTNITSFQPPITNGWPVLLRIRQQYP